MAKKVAQQKATTRGTSEERNPGTRTGFSTGKDPQVNYSFQKSPGPADKGTQQAIEGVKTVGSAAANVGTNLYLSQQQENLEEARDQVEALGFAGRGGFSEAERSVLDESSAVFKNYNTALQQGAMNSEAAQIAIESEVKRLSNKFPPLAEKVRKMASDTLGFDPTGSSFAFATSDQGELTDQQKEVQEVQQMADASDYTFDEIWSMRQRSKVLELKADITKSEAAVRKPAEQELSDIREERRIKGNSQMLLQGQLVANQARQDILGLVQEFGGAEGLTEEGVGQAYSLINRARTKLTQQSQKFFSEHGIKAGKQDEYLASYTQELDELEELVKNRKLVDSLKNNKQTQQILQESLLKQRIPGANLAMVISEGTGSDFVETLKFVQNQDMGGWAGQASEFAKRQNPVLQAADDLDVKNNLHRGLKKGIKTGNWELYEQVDPDGTMMAGLYKRNYANKRVVGNDRTGETESGGGPTGNWMVDRLAKIGQFDVVAETIANNPEKALQVDSNKKALEYAAKEFPNTAAQTLLDVANKRTDTILGGDVGAGDIRVKWIPASDSSTRESATTFEESEGRFVVEAPSRMSTAMDTDFIDRDARRGVQTVQGGMEAAWTPIEAAGAAIGDLIPDAKQGVEERLNNLGKTLSTSAGQSVTGLTPQDVADRINQRLQLGQKEIMVTGEKSAKKATRQAAVKADISADLFSNLIEQESNFGVQGDQYNPAIKSPTGATGLAQFTKSTARRMGLQVDDAIDERTIPEKALPASAKLLKGLLDRYNGDEALAIAAYNAGPSAVSTYRKTGSAPPVVVNGETVVSSEQKTRKMVNHVKQVTGENLFTYVEQEGE